MLSVHRAEQAEQLVAALAAVLVEPPADPFTPDVVAVPSRGIERWLAHRLSNVLGTSPGRADGVCANVTFPFPARLIGTALQAVTGVDPTADPWDPGRAVWPLLEVIDEHLDDEWMRTLSSHLGGAGQPDDGEWRARRFATARRLAELFDRYAVHRPEMLVHWAAGDDVDEGAALPADVTWQATLWRLLRDHIGVPSPAERLVPACDRLRDEPALVGLPDRVAAYGLTRLAPSMLQVLDALATARDVHLFLLHPSPALWERVRAEPGAVAAHPLLATWGKDSRDMQPALAASVGSFTDRHHAATATPLTLLQRLQDDIGHDVRPPGAPLGDAVDERLVLAGDDDSVRVHSCHGRARQVEVLRDAITHLLADDPTLEPRDVIVMCPDIETFAPLVHATFGPGDVTGATGAPVERRLQVRLADRALRQTNPVLAVLAELLELATTRITASQLLDFAGREPVRRRFRLDDDDVERIEAWASSAGVRWGLDAAHRAPWQLHQLGTNTWHAGLDRILLGVSMTEDELPLLGEVLPLDDVDSGDIELAGRFAELVERVRTAVVAFGGRRSPADWATAISAAMDALTACAPLDGWQRAELDRLLADVVAQSGTTGGGIDITLPELRSLLGDRLRGRPSRANFRTGHLTVCTLVPMRSVPHRVVCLLGLDDGTFPRQGAPDGDDIVQRVHVPGDRDVRNEDRQLLLDALLAASDHLVITFGGRDERTNAALPPSVPVGELLDVVDATARGAIGPAREQVVVEHPLQPFDERNFVAGRLRPHDPWSFDREALDGARALRASPAPTAAFLPGGPLPAIDSPVVELDDLVRFVEHPTKAFLRRRLGVSLGGGDDEIDDAIPIELGGLARWDVGGRLLGARLSGVDSERAIAAEVARGTLPPLALGTSVVDGVRDGVEAIAATVAHLPVDGPTRSVDVHVDLGPAGTLAGTVPDVRGTCLLRATFSTIAPKHRIAAWVRLLALAATHPDEDFTAVTIGRGRGSVGSARLPALSADAARGHLAVLLDLHRRGMREPLPLYTKTSEAFARHGQPRREWFTPDRAVFHREDREPEHLRVLGGQVPFEALLVERPRPDEDGPGWDAGQPTRFGRYAVRLWQPLLAHEERDGLW